MIRRTTFAWILASLAACSDGSGGGTAETVQAWVPLGESAWGKPHTERARGAGSTGGGITHTFAENTISQREPSTLMDAQGGLWVAWQDDSGLNLQRWDGSRWIEFGGPSNLGWGTPVTSDLFGPAVALDVAGNPTLAWSNGNEVYVRRWDGSSWVGIGVVGAQSASVAVYDAQLALDSSGNPVVLWRDNRSAGWQVRLKRWNGAAWVGLGGSDSGSGVSGGAASVGDARLVLDSAGNPIVVWKQGSPSDLYLRRWNGSAWGSPAPIASTAGDSVYPSLAIDGAGNLFVAWNETVGATPEIYLLQWDGVSWIALGNSASGNGLSGTGAVPEDSPSLALQDGSPVVAWRANDGNGVYVKRWDGAAWSGLSGSATGTGLKLAPRSALVNCVSLASGPAGTLSIVWIVDGHWDRNIYVREWDGSAWVAFEDADSGGLSHDSSGESWRPALAMDASGNPFVAWEHMKSSVWSGDIYVRGWNGAAWIDLGGSAANGGISQSGNGYTPAIAVGPDGNPVVAWQNLQPSDTLEDIYVKRWNGSAWVELGGSASGGGISQSGAAFRPSLVLDLAGNPVVAWWDEDVGAGFLKKWDGTAWIQLGQFAGASPVVTLDAAGNPVFAWVGLHQVTGTGSYVFVKKWNGSAWVGLGGSAIGGGISTGSGAENLSIDADAAGRIVVAWEEDLNLGGPGEIHLSRWNGSAWEQLAGSATGVGVSATSGESMTPSIAIDAFGHPVVAWQERTPVGYEIYVKSWNGSAWVEFRSEAASGGGVSNSNGFSRQPQIATRNRRTSVAWTDWGPLTGIYLRQTVGP